MYNGVNPLKKCGWCANVSDVSRVGGVPSWVRVQICFAWVKIYRYESKCFGAGQILFAVA